MNFKDLKIGQILYILNKDKMQLHKSTIVTVSAPHIENKANSITQLVVDVTTNLDGKPITYVMPDNSSITYCDGEIITADKTCLINELKALKIQHEQIVNAYEFSKEAIDKCDGLISELDDAFREKKENDERLSKLELMMKTLLDKFSTQPVQMQVVAQPNIVAPIS